MLFMWPCRTSVIPWRSRFDSGREVETGIARTGCPQLGMSAAQRASNLAPTLHLDAKGVLL